MREVRATGPRGAAPRRASLSLDARDSLRAAILVEGCDADHTKWEGWKNVERLGQADRPSVHTSGALASGADESKGEM